jgi:hypothetical protein
MLEINTVIQSSSMLKDCVDDFRVNRVQQLISPEGSSITAYPGISESIIGDHPNVLFIDEASQHPPGEKSDKLYFEVLLPTQIGGAMESEETRMHLIGTWGRDIGFAARIYEKIKTGVKTGLDYTLLELPWYDCEGYTKEKMHALKEEIGEIRFYTEYGGKGFLPSGFINIDPIAIPRNVYTNSELYNLKTNAGLGYSGLSDLNAPTWIGVDPGKEVHKTGIIVVQESIEHYKTENNGKQFPKFKIVDFWVKQPLKYEEVYKQVDYFYKRYNNTQSVIVDSTGLGNVVKDEIENRGMKCEGVGFGGEKNRRMTLFNKVKDSIESIDENNRGRLIIPENFTEVINSIKYAQVDKHLPDLFCALSVVLYTLKGSERVYKYHDMLSVRKENPLDSYGIDFNDRITI